MRRHLQQWRDSCTLKYHMYMSKFTVGGYSSHIRAKTLFRILPEAAEWSMLDKDSIVGIRSAKRNLSDPAPLAAGARLTWPKIKIEDRHVGQKEEQVWRLFRQGSWSYGCNWKIAMWQRQAWRAIHTYMQKMASDHAMGEIAAYRCYRSHGWPLQKPKQNLPNNFSQWIHRYCLRTTPYLVQHTVGCAMFLVRVHVFLCHGRAHCLASSSTAFASRRISGVALRMSSMKSDSPNALCKLHQCFWVPFALPSSFALGFISWLPVKNSGLVGFVTEVQWHH